MENKRLNRKLITAVLLCSGVFFAVVTRAAVQISTNIPGMPTSGTSPCDFVFSFYKFAMTLSGVLAFGAIVFGGVKYTLAAGNPSGQSEGKEWVKGALLGMLLLVSAYLILNVINPDLTKCTLPELTKISDIGGGSITASSTAVSSGCNVATFSGSSAVAPGLGGEIKFMCVSGGDCPGLTCNDGCQNYAAAGCPGGAAGCPNCVSISGTGFYCKSANSCTANPAMISELQCIAQKSGVALKVTEAYPPTVNHISQCHNDGCCVDTAINSFTSCSQVDAVVSAAQQCGAISVANEYANCGGRTYDTTTGNNIHIQACN